MPSYVVTGAARGIGHEFVRQLSASQENVVFALVRDKRTADKLNALGKKNVHILEADITDTKALKEAAKFASGITDGKLDVLINNAALVASEYVNTNLDEYPSEQALEDDLVKAFKVNTVGVAHTINAFLPLLKAGATKKVLTISTGAADLDFTLGTEESTLASYSVSKASLNLLVAKYAMKYKPEGFVFLSISPGMVNTATKPPSPEELKAFESLMASFRKVAPTFEGPITPEESVKLMLDIFERTTVKDTGAFISHKGNKEWL